MMSEEPLSFENSLEPADGEESLRITKEGLDTIMTWARMKAQIWEMTEDMDSEDTELDLDLQVAFLLPYVIIPFYRFIEWRDEIDQGPSESGV